MRAKKLTEILTPAELRMAECVSRGLSNRCIAADLALSPRYVKHKLALIYEKLGMDSSEAERGPRVLLAVRYVKGK